MGGLPLAFSHRIEEDLRAFERLNIRPVFVFSGLPTSARPPAKGGDGAEARELLVRNEAWGAYECGDPDSAVLALCRTRNGAWTDQRDVLRLILRFFRHRFVEYVIAPYHQFGQVSGLDRPGGTRSLC
jgi:hypothetical protein